jgi:hypothetical protein
MDRATASTTAIREGIKAPSRHLLDIVVSSLQQKV